MSQATDAFDTEDYANWIDFNWDAAPDLSPQLPSQTKPWRGPAVQSPSTPSNDRSGALSNFLGDHSPSTTSRPSRSGTGNLGSTSAIMSRSLSDLNIDNDSDEPIPFPRLSFAQEGESNDWEDLDEGVLQRASSSAMNPPAAIPNPPPLQATSTQSSLDSTTSADSLFSERSTTSTSSFESTGPQPQRRSSSLKRGVERHPMSPSKTRKISQAQQASPQSGVLVEAPRPRAATVTSPVKIQLSTVHAETTLDKESTFPLAALFGGDYASKLDAYVIAHCTEVQTRFDNMGIELGVQWELARGVLANKWTWKDVDDKFKAQYNVFRGTNSLVAEQVPDIMRGLPQLKTESRNLALWNEVDREEKAIREGKGRGLGLMGRWESWEGHSDYYGGQIQYPLRLVKSDDAGSGNYGIFLDKPRKGRSHRFARDLGSPSVLQLSIPSQLFKDESEEKKIKHFLTKRFVINGRIFVPIPPKDNSSVYLIQINQNWRRRPLPYYGDQFRVSFEEFMQRHNPPELNSQQPFAKYTARYALGLSTSTPVLEFEKKNIFYIQDILAQGWDPTQKPPAEKIMTDGCGFINRSALLSITKTVGYASLPTAVQGRIGGAKGLWILHPTDEDASPRIWIRDSQVKIRLQGEHRVHRIFDLLRASHPSQTEARHKLSEQSILCLSSNGIPDDVLVRLLVDGLEQTVKPLLDWGTGAMPTLWRAVGNAGSVSASRLQRIAGSKSRVLGFRKRDSEKLDEEPDTTAMDIDSSASVRSGRDNGGGPLSLHESAMELIQAGFNPKTSAYLNEKMRFIIRTEIKSIVDKYRISLPESTASDAFVIPDPFGILRKNEIYYRSSKPMKNPATQTLFHTLVGPVIVSLHNYRSCILSQVTAVNVPELYDFPDVIITSIAGDQSLLSFLSGGDTVIFLWLEEFLNNFKNQPFTPPPHNFIAENFEREVKTVEEVGNELQLRFKSPKDAQQAFQEYLLGGLRDSQVGLYSFFHENAIWRHGYNHPSSILMAYIGNTLLDAGKTGLCLKREVFAKHRATFGHQRPKTDGWRGEVNRDDNSRPYILQRLSEAGDAKGGELLREHDRASGKLVEAYKDMPKDEDLLKPHVMAKHKSERDLNGAEVFYKAELAAIEHHVEEVRRLYGPIYAIPEEEKVKREAAALAMHCKYSQAVPGVKMMEAATVEELKASYAYSLKEGFGFTVAFQTLCFIKARATGGLAPNCRHFDELKTISGAASRATLDDEDV
ncbi:RNA dependent RNA polymerase-domain-containing protein [Mycena latifolia]|nr:RNA dependent RNA polymerase-domain-containing protein [Mycena latifolia]